jgi:uncharacterized protein
VIDELQRLWDLHGLDEEIGACRSTLARFDAQRKDLAQRLAAERIRHDAVQHRITELQVRRRTIEKDIEAATAEERKFQSQLPAIKKNEEYQALLHEITLAKGRRSDLETSVLQHMDAEEAAQRERQEAERALKEYEREIVERGAKADREEAVEQARLEELEGRKREVLAGLPPAVAGRYQRILASRDGRAVVPIVKGACGGCFRQQPPQVQQEARRRDRLLICDGCGRMLVLAPDDGSV